jgi:hypothetical protein
MEKVNLENIIKSYFLGIFIGIVLQFVPLKDNIEASTSYSYLKLLASGSLGFIIGFITEWVTSKLPISLAKPRNYFFINNLIAIIATALIMVFSIMVTNGNIESIKEFAPILLIILGIVLVANIADYMIFYRTQNQLKKYQGLLKDK